MNLPPLQTAIVKAILEDDKYMIVCEKDKQVSYKPLSRDYSVMAARQILEEGGYEIVVVYNLDDPDSLVDL